MLEVDDPVAILQCGQAVSDHDDGDMLAERCDRGHDPFLGAGVERRCRLVEHQYRGALVEGAGNADALALTPRQANAALAGRGGIAVGKPGNEVADPGRGGGFLDPAHVDLVSGNSKGDVGGERIVGEVDRLGDMGDFGLPARAAVVIEPAAIDQDRAVARLKQAEEEIHQRALARSGGSGDSDPLAAANDETDVVEHLSASRVGKADPVEGDRLAEDGAGRGLGQGADVEGDQIDDVDDGAATADEARPAVIALLEQGQQPLRAERECAEHRDRRGQSAGTAGQRPGICPDHRHADHLDQDSRRMADERIDRRDPAEDVGTMIELALERRLRAIEQDIADSAECFLDAFDAENSVEAPGLGIATEDGPHAKTDQEIGADQQPGRDQCHRGIDRDQQCDEQDGDDAGDYRLTPRQQSAEGDVMEFLELAQRLARMALDVVRIRLADELGKGGDT